MRRSLGFFAICALLFLSIGHFGCGSETSSPNDDDGNSATPAPTPSVDPNTDVNVSFSAVGPELNDDLIDIEFLPGQNGESIVIGQGGVIYYLRSDFSLVGTSNIANFEPDFVSSGEMGLLNVAADPSYATNHLVYFYFTTQPGGSDVNRVAQFQVNVNTSTASPAFALANEAHIIDFPKAGTANNHNGGSMLFMTSTQMAIGVGDGGDTPNAAQDTDSRLGKIHRIIPHRDGSDGFDFPPNQQPGGSDNVSATEPSIYSLGLRNPFTMAVDEDGDLFIGDVGQGEFEEINCVYFDNENYGWPTCEGDCPSSVTDPFQDPIHGYAHEDTTFSEEDPEENNDGPKSILVNLIYQGNQYGGLLNGRLIYSEFFAGWVRLLTLDPLDRVIGDQHIGHQTGMTSLQMNPADNLLYGVTLFGGNQILRMDLVP